MYESARRSDWKVTAELIFGERSIPMLLLTAVLQEVANIFIVIRTRYLFVILYNEKTFVVIVAMFIQYWYSSNGRRI